MPPLHPAIPAVLLSAALAAPPRAAAQEGPLALSRLAGPIALDGRPDEPAWDGATVLPLTMYTPVFRGSPTQRSEIRVGYDDEHLYFAGWFYDNVPGGIRVNSLYRDRWNGDDAFAIYLDVFNDNRNAKWFGITPAGMRFDQLLSDDGQTFNGAWDAFWDARTRITNEGWFAEVRIPFSTLGFQAADGRAVMGLTVTRLLSRVNERVTFPAIDPRYEFRQPSVARDVTIEGVRSDKPLYATPYALAGVQRTPRLEPGAPAYASDRETVRELGLDLRYGLSSELTADLTLNTDFAQVEADDQQVNLDRFSLFFPEKRRFFQERADIFEFGMGRDGGRLFHSRQIGLAPDERVPVHAGARLVGRVGAWDVGLLEMQTGSTATGKGENFGVARVRRRVLNDYSHGGAMLTSRLGDERHNVALGVDGDFRVTGDHYFSWRWAQTFDEADPADASLLDRAQLHLAWQHRVTRGLNFQLSASRSGTEYRPDLGFLPRRDFRSADAVANWFFYTDGHPFLRRVYPGALAFSTFRNSDGALESAQYAVWVQWDTKTGGGGWIEPKLFHENVAAPFSIGGEVEIPAGSYSFADLQLVFFMPSGARLRTGVDARAGRYFDGTRAQLILTPTWNLSRHLELGGAYQMTRLRFPERDQATDIHLARFRVRAAFDARASGNAFVQYNSTTDRLALNLRLRYNFSEGTDLWLVYDETLATERLDDGLTPLLPRSTSRGFMIKYSHTLRL